MHARNAPTFPGKPFFGYCGEYSTKATCEAIYKNELTFSLDHLIVYRVKSLIKFLNKSRGAGKGKEIAMIRPDPVSNFFEL
jgi:hypothetical protein